MIGNVIQGQYLELANYPVAAALSFMFMALIMIAVLLYLRFAGTGALIGDDESATVETTATGQHASRRGHGVLGWLRAHALNLYAGIAVAYMLIPIAVIAVFSFNDPTGSFNFTWQGFTLDYWAHPFAQSDLTDALVTSLELAALSTVIATAIGTMLALALVRHRFRGRRAANVLILIPMATPEVVIGAALLSMFVYVGVARGFTTLLIAHVMFSISFVVVIVRSRLIGFDRSLEDVAADLGAGPLTAFRTVTLPLLAPAILAAALLAFALSIDDFVISNFNSGTTVTFPLYIFGASQRGSRSRSTCWRRCCSRSRSRRWRSRSGSSGAPSAWPGSPRTPDGRRPAQAGAGARSPARPRRSRRSPPAPVLAALAGSSRPESAGGRIAEVDGDRLRHPAHRERVREQALAPVARGDAADRQRRHGPPLGVADRRRDRDRVGHPLADTDPDPGLGDQLQLGGELFGVGRRVGGQALELGAADQVLGARPPAGSPAAPCRWHRSGPGSDARSPGSSASRAGRRRAAPGRRWRPSSSASTTASRHSSRSRSMCGRAALGTFEAAALSAPADRSSGPSRYSSRRPACESSPLATMSESVR